MDITRVDISRSAQKDIRKLPGHIVDKLQFWIELVETKGLAEVRKIPGFHDEPLLGDRKGERSIRLNRGYRAIYREVRGGEVEFVRIEEVNKHAY